jgi:hypothetical protein
MQLSGRALQTLQQVKARMLEDCRVGAVPPRGDAEVRTTPSLQASTRFPEPIARLQQKDGRVMRHAKVRGRAFQQMCRRRDWAAPLY